MAMLSMVRVGLAAGCGVVLVTLTGCGQGAATGSETAPPSVSPTPATAPSSAAVPDREPHTLVLNATGSGRVTSMKYTLDGRLVRRGAVKLPWRESVAVPADGRPHSWTLEVEFRGSGRVNLVAIFDGQVVAQGGSAGSGGNTRGGASVNGTVNG